MKKALSVFLAVVLILAAAAAAADTWEPIGTVEKLFGSIAVYCNNWNTIYGSAFGADLSFDSENVNMKEGEHERLGRSIYSFNFDGIDSDVDSDGNVYETSICFSEGGALSYPAIVRSLAVIASVGYGFPGTSSEMKQRFMDLFERFIDAYDAGKNDLLNGQIYSWTIKGDKMDVDVYFTKVDQQINFNYNHMIPD